MQAFCKNLILLLCNIVFKFSTIPHKFRSQKNTEISYHHPLLPPYHPHPHHPPETSGSFFSRKKLQILLCERILALALFAVFFVHILPLECFLAAITAVEIATTVVVIVVTVAIAFVVRRTAFIFRFVAAGGIHALTFFAVFFDNSLLECFRAAITAVEIATTVVVYVVTVAIAFVVRRTAFVVAATFFFVATIVFSSVFSSVFGIQALAFFAVFLIDSLP